MTGPKEQVKFPSGRKTQARKQESRSVKLGQIGTVWRQIALHMFPLGKRVIASVPTRCPGFREKIGVCGKGVRQGGKDPHREQRKIDSILLSSVTCGSCDISLHGSPRLGLTVFSIRLWVQLLGYLKEKGKSGKVSQQECGCPSLRRNSEFLPCL